MDVCEKLRPVLGIIKLVVKIIQFGVPIILILFGSIDLIKAVTKGKEEDITKQQKILAKRALAAVLVLLIPALVDVIMGLVGGDATWATCWKTTKPGIPPLM